MNQGEVISAVQQIYAFEIALNSVITETGLLELWQETISLLKNNIVRFKKERRNLLAIAYSRTLRNISQKFTSLIITEIDEKELYFEEMNRLFLGEIMFQHSFLGYKQSQNMVIQLMS